MWRKGEVKTAWDGAIEKRGSHRSAKLAFLFVWWNDAFNNVETTKHRKKLNGTERD